MVDFPFQRLFIAALAALAMTACENASNDDAAQPPDVAPAPILSDDEVATVASGVNDFAARLYGALDARHGAEDNLFFSPLSIEAAFGIVLLGAKGETAEEMADALSLPSADSDTHDRLGSLMRGMARPGSADEPTLTVANAVWTQEGYPLRADYLDMARSRYAAVVEPLDIRGDADLSARRINNWMARETRDRIKTVVKPAMLDSSTVLVVTNAIYFLGDWTNAFSPDQTTNQPFYVPGDTRDVPLMYRTMDVRHITSADFQATDLPYKGDGLSMSVILPDDRAGLDRVEARMAGGELTEVLAALDNAAPREVFVYLPKLEIETDINLIPPLSDLGMKLPFGGRADLTGIADADLHISAAVHKAFLKVDERGTEAAAATAVVVAEAAAVEPPPTFRADRPYMFVIRDRGTGTILFIGRISNPLSAE